MSEHSSELPSSGSRLAEVPCAVRPAAARRERVAEQAAGAHRPRHLESALRRIESLPLGHLWLALGLGAALAALYLAWCAAFGVTHELRDPTQPLHLSTGTQIHAVVAVLLAFFVATRRYIERRSPIELSHLQALTCCTREEFARLVKDQQVAHRRRLRCAEAVGALVGLVVVLASSDAGALLRQQAWEPRAAWGILTSTLLFGLMGRAAYESVIDGRLLGRIAREIAEINLLDQRALRPFARRGLHRAFFWVGGSTIASLLALHGERLGPLLAVLGGTLVLATLAFLEPARSIRARLREAKRDELARVRSEIVRAKEAALRSGGDAEAARLPGLLAYEARVEAVREWPFDTPTLVRFGALALLATGSWLGGAMVERLLGSVLD